MSSYEALHPAAAGALPVIKGGRRLTRAEYGAVWAVQRYPGAEPPFAFPGPGTALALEDGTLVWSGREEALWLGTAPPHHAWSETCALTDQGSAWCILRLTGPGATDVLARHVPVDLRPLSPGHSVKTLLGHMTALIWMPEDGVFEIITFRSMAHTTVHEITDAMASVAARDL